MKGKSEHADAQPQIEGPHPQHQHEPSQHALPPLVGSEPEKKNILLVLRQQNAHDLVNTAQKPHYYWLIFRSCVDIDGVCLGVRSRVEIQSSIDVD